MKLALHKRTQGVLRTLGSAASEGRDGENKGWDHGKFQPCSRRGDTYPHLSICQ